MTHDIRAYDRSRDLTAVTRIWREVGWIDDDDQEPALERYLDDAHVEVGLVEGEAECAVCWGEGSIRHQDRDLSLGVVAAVTTSRIARRLGLASALTARAVRAAARSGAAVAALGMFDQGFYNRLGFGVGPYLHTHRFDPSSLDLDHIAYRPPIRLGPDDAEEANALARRRHRVHGGVVVDSAVLFRSEMEWTQNPIALGYRNAEGRLTHALFGSATGEHGPYRIRAMAYEEPGQLLELLRLLQELGDQVHTVKIDEPPEIQLQDLIRRPFHQARRGGDGPNAAGSETEAWMQLRILDLAAVVAAGRFPGSEVECVLDLVDPITEVLGRGRSEPPSGWAGCGGRYRLRVGSSSSVEPLEGQGDGGVPVLRASVGAFTRLWFGVRPASSLTLTDQLDGPPDLLAALDDTIRLPSPHPGWDF